ncbi:MAG: galactokinase [Planctomycetota bacterium]|nr:MAG: galactokinase [Planctomycetota bacterium]
MQSERVEQPLPTLDELAVRHGEAFRERFGGGGSARIFYAPGRVNLLGAHLDYNGGPVVPTAIDRGTLLAVRPRADRRLRLASTLEEVALECELDALPATREGRWSDYPLGVVVDLVGAARAEQRAEELCGLEILFGGNLPVGAGLSSSASICVGTALVLDSVWELGLDPMERVLCALRAERGFVGVQCGIMDPYAVGLARPGHVLWLDCKDATWEHLSVDLERVSMGIADSGVRREVARGAFNQRVAECAEAFAALRAFVPGAECLRDIPIAVLAERGGELAPNVRKRAEHVLHEVERTFLARAALLAGDFAGMGAFMTASHASLRDLYEVSCAELDVLVDAASASDGCYGARLTGAGFGGCIVMLVERGAEDAVRAGVTAQFEARFARTPDILFFGGDEGPREISTPS